MNGDFQLLPPNDIDSGWTFGQVEEYANQLYARAKLCEERLATVEADRDAVIGDLDNHRLYVAEYAGYAQIAKDALAAAEARVEALQPYLRHRHGCGSTATAGGMFAPGPCTCGLRAVLSPVADTQQEQPHDNRI